MHVELVQSRDIIRNVRERWLKQYTHYSDTTLVGWGDQLPAGEIRQRLNGLDLETCTKADVDTALQSKGWAENKCDLCERDVETTLQIGEEPGYDARWVCLCPECVATLPNEFSKS